MERAIPPDPYQFLPDVPSFQLTSTDVTDGEPMPARHASAVFGVEGGEDLSPQLAWSGFPAETKQLCRHCVRPGCSYRKWVLALGSAQRAGIGHRAAGGCRRR